MKYSEIILKNLRNAGWNCGCISSTDSQRATFWVVAAERSDAGRFVRANEKLTAFLELESSIQNAATRSGRTPTGFEERKIKLDKFSWIA